MMNRARRIGDGLKVRSRKLLKKILFAWTLMITSTFDREQPHLKNTRKLLHKDITVGVVVGVEVEARNEVAAGNEVVVGAEVVAGDDVVVVVILVVLVREAVQRKRKRRNGHHIAETDQIKDIKVEN